MAVADVAQSIASQQEMVRNKIADLSLSASVFWKLIETDTTIKPVSGRPFRLPTEPVMGAKFKVGGFDGSDMGIGSGPQEVPGTGTCVSFVQASSYTALSDWSTDSDEKAVESFADRVHRNAAKTFGGYMDVLAQGDASNTLDTVVSVSGSTITVNNANKFQNNQDIDVWTAIGGTFVSTYTILTADAVTSVLTMTTSVSGVSTGYALLVNGSSGQANTGINGLRTFGVSTNTGLWMNVPRTSFPGMYTTPSIAVGGALTPATVRLLESLVELAMGMEEDDDEVIAHCTPNERNQWENNSLLIQRIDLAEAKRDGATDTLSKRGPTVIAGRKMVVNPRGTPGYIDFVPTKNWGRVETKPQDFYSVAGQTLFPIYGASGGLTSSFVFYLVWVGQLYELMTREASFLSGITVSKGIFGK